MSDGEFTVQLEAPPIGTDALRLKGDAFEERIYNTLKETPAAAGGTAETVIDDALIFWFRQSIKNQSRVFADERVFRVRPNTK
jgi:hypothetical protein